MTAAPFRALAELPSMPNADTKLAWRREAHAEYSDLTGTNGMKHIIRTALVGVVGGGILLMPRHCGKEKHRDDP